ncbi:MAG: endonuclease/exonuclease/phosphatase family protein [Phycisphaerales bacterium]|nr:endonuclease/exonuclease/phosphatase family protein [Phycisphaerales bacterium]
MKIRCALAALGGLLLGPVTASAQWSPSTGQWGRTDPRDLRVMTWNVQDCICRTDPKAEALASWCAVARIVAAMKPDVLILQECGDNGGNGTGSGVDSIAQLTTTLELFMHGGPDPFRGGTVGAYVQKYDPAYDLPYIYVGEVDDGFNRNVLLSRYPLTDLNGDTRAAISQPVVGADLYAPGGTGGIRGFIFAEINLPDASYAGDLVMGCAHLRSGSQASDLAERLTASRNVAYYVDYLFNGGGGPTPDPRAKIADSPQATSILAPATPVIMGGDWNEDELTNGRDGPALWLTRAQAASPGGSDGTDRDRTDSLYDDSRDVFSPSDRATQSSSKLDYIAWQDSIASLRRSFIFKSSTIPPGGFPPELIGFASTPALATSAASDHRPIVADFILPAPTISLPGPFSLLSPADGAAGLELTPTLDWSDSTGAETYTVRIAADPAFASVIYTSAPIPAATSSFALPAATLAECSTYYWGVTALNSAGPRSSTPESFRFDTLRPADLTGDGLVDFSDYLEFLNLYDAEDPRVDFNGDGFIDFADYLEFLNHYDAGC